jgi:peptide/nickel transport system substrate-binding protein
MLLPLFLDAVNVYLFQLARTGVQKKGLKGLWRNAPVQANDVTQVRWE